MTGSGESAAKPTYAYSYEAPGFVHPKQALRDLTTPTLGEHFDSIKEDHFDLRLRLGYSPQIRRSDSPIGFLDRHLDDPPSRDRVEAVRALKDPAFRLSWLEFNRAGRKAVRDLLDRLAEGDVVAFGSHCRSNKTSREEISGSAWAGAAVRDYPIHGRDWAIRVRGEWYGDLTFHRSETLLAWREGLQLDRALEALSPTQMAAYRRSLEGVNLDDVDLEQSYLHWDLMSAVGTGAFELQVLYPPGPSAEFVRVSAVQSTTPHLNDINLQTSEVRLRGTGWLPARMRHIGIRESAASIKANQTIAADTKAFKLLLNEAKSDPKTKTRDQYLHWLVDEIPGLSFRGAKRAWTAVTRIERFRHWSNSGRMKGN
jgi:hypothetical protein